MDRSGRGCNPRPARVSRHTFRMSDCIFSRVRASSAREPGYFETLSEASVHSLNLQGGPMDDDEAAAFEAHRHFKAIIAVRRYDEAGKEVGMEVPPFSSYLPMLERMVAGHA